MNPYTDKDSPRDKQSIFDIQAKTAEGKLINVEMQRFNKYDNAHGEQGHLLERSDRSEDALFILLPRKHFKRFSLSSLLALKKRK